MHNSARYRSPYRRSYREAHHSSGGGDIRERFIVQGMVCGVILAALIATSLIGLPYTERIIGEVVRVIQTDDSENLQLSPVVDMFERARYFVLGELTEAPVNITPAPSTAPQTLQIPEPLEPYTHTPHGPATDTAGIMTYEDNENNTFYELGDEERLFIEDIIRRIHESGSHVPEEGYPEYADPAYSQPEYAPDNLEPHALAPAVPPGSARVSSPFGNRINPLTGATEFHNGIDMAFAHGTPIVAIQDGVVTEISYNAYSGNYLRYMTSDGLLVGYAHLYNILVEVGDIVRQGDVVALTGNSGLSTGPHLHVTIWQDGATIDPLTVFAMY